MKVTRTFQRRIGWRAIRHAVVETDIHKQDVETARERRSTQWIGVEIERKNTHRIIPNLGGGLYFSRERGTDKLVERNGKDFIQELDWWKKEKSYYMRWAPCKKTKGGYRWKKTRTNGIQGLVCTCAPWWSQVIYAEAEMGNDAKVREFARLAALDLKNTFERETKRQVISVQAHFDTQNLHFHVWSSRIGADHKFIPGTRKGFGIMGKWSVGVMRQAINGVIPKASVNHKKAVLSKERKSFQFGRNPIDWEMAKTIDILCKTMFGESAGAKKALYEYRQQVNEKTVTGLMELAGKANRELKIWRHFMEIAGIALKIN